jgi:hypothetical protein
MQFTYPWTSLKDVKVIGEAFSPPKRNPALQKWKFINLVFWQRWLQRPTALIPSILRNTGI